MPSPLRRTLRIGALALACVVAAGFLYMAFVYRSLDVFSPPDRITSLDRTYLLNGSPPLTREQLDERYSPTHRERYSLERVGTLLPFHAVYQWQNDEIRGQATTSAFVEWGDRYVRYSLSGGP